MKEQRGEDGVRIMTDEEGKEKEMQRIAEALTGIWLRKWEEARKVAPDENQACQKTCDRLERLKKEDKQAQQKKRLSGGGEGRGTHEEEKKPFGAWQWWAQWLVGWRARTDVDGTGGESDREGCSRAGIKMGGKNGGETDDSSGLHSGWLNMVQLVCFWACWAIVPRSGASGRGTCERKRYTERER